MAIPAASSYSQSLQVTAPKPVGDEAEAPRPRAPSLRSLAPTGSLLQAADALPSGYRRDAPPARKESGSEDSGKSDSDSASCSDADTDEDAADRTSHADPRASASPQAAPQSSSSEDSGKSDSDSTSYSDDERDVADDALDGTPTATGSADLSRPATAQAEPAGTALGDALFAGVTTIRADDIGVGAYLASGSFGKVYRGTWGAEAVALKEIDYAHARQTLPLSEEEFLEAMQWEVSRMATASHPNLVQFHGLCRKEGKTYIVMEFCDGGSLARALEKGGIPPSRLWQWMREIADALAFLHGQGMLHRDLKAENILLDGRGRARLADLGVAQVDALLDETEAKAVNMGMQDVSFIAPENIVNVQGGSLRQSSKATDIYALGTVFWQMVSGGAAPSPWEVVLFDPAAKAALAAGVRMPIPEDCPQPVRDLILSCWRTKPAERADIAAVLRQLREMGPQLHPQAAIIEMLEHLEASVHPMRSQVRDYVPTQVTARRVEGSVDAYCTQREQQAGATPVHTVTTGGYTGVNSTATNTTSAPSSSSSSTLAVAAASTKPNPPMPLQATLDEFVAEADAGALLLLGEGGMGKSISTMLLAERLLQQWWRHLADPTGVPRPRHLPIFISDHVTEWSDAAIDTAWPKLAARIGLAAAAAQPLVFFDAYDECRFDKDKATNLGKHLGLPLDAKLIVTCRPYVVKEEDQSERFAWNGRLVTRHALPFTLDQMLDYLHARLDWDAATHARYQARLQQSADLRAVLRIPFMLYLLRQSWETVGRQPLEELTRARLYAGFIAHMVDKCSKLLAPEVRATLQGDGASLADAYAAFTESIALLAAFEESASLSAREADKAASPWSRLEDLIREEAGRRYEEREAQLARLDESRQREHKRRKVLSLEDFIAMRSQVAAQLHAMLPLRLRGGVYEYVHKSVFEYCAARKLLLEVRRGNDGITEESLDSVLRWMETSAPGILLFVDEFLQLAEAEGVDPEAGQEVVQWRMSLIFNAVGIAMRAMQKYEKALAFLGKAAAIREMVLGTAHAATATSHNNISILLHELGRHEEALTYSQKAVPVLENVFGTEHADTASAYDNMGRLLGAVGRHEEALAYSRKATAVREKVLGTEHAATATSYNNMGSVLQDLHRHEEALAYYRQAMAVEEKVFGTEHGRSATSYNNMGSLLKDLGRGEEALTYYRKAVAVAEKVFGTEHATTATFYYNLGLRLCALGRREEGLAYSHKAMVVHEKVFGTEHPITSTCHNNLGVLLHASGQREEALVYYRKAMVAREKVLGPKHAKTADSYGNMGSLLHDVGRHEEALVYSRKAMVACKKVFGTEHAETAICCSNMAKVLEALGRHEKALAYYRKALDIAEMLHHPDANLYREAIASLGKSVDAHTKPPPEAQDPRQHRPPRPPARRSTPSPQALLPSALQSDTAPVEGPADDDDPEEVASSADDGKARRGSRRKCDVM